MFVASAFTETYSYFISTWIKTRVKFGKKWSTKVNTGNLFMFGKL